MLSSFEGAPYFQRARDTVSHWALRANARLKNLRGQDFAIGFGGLLAGVVLAAVAIQRPPERPDAKPVVAAKAEPRSAPDSVPIKMLGTSAENARPCAEQTWPYIERRCLTEAPPRVDEPVTQAIAAPLRIEPIADVAAEAPKPAETNAVANSEAQAEPEPFTVAVESKPEAQVSDDAIQRKERAKRRAERKAKQDLDGRKATEMAANDNDENKNPTGKRARAEPARKQSVQKGQRWRELVYDYPDGTRKRVILTGASRSVNAIAADDE